MSLNPQNTKGPLGGQKTRGKGEKGRIGSGGKVSGSGAVGGGIKDKEEKKVVEEVEEKQEKAVVERKQVTEVRNWERDRGRNGEPLPVMDETEKAIAAELSSLDEYLNSIGKVRLAVAKDGACMFRSMAQALYWNQSLHMVVRQACVEHLLDNEPEYVYFIDLQGDADDEEGRHKEYLMYTQSMLQPSTWGGQLELQALSQRYHRNFQIYQAVLRRNTSDPTTETVPTHDIATTQISNGFDHLVHLAYSHGNHYDVVLDIDHLDQLAYLQKLVHHSIETFFQPKKERHTFWHRPLAFESDSESPISFKERIEAYDNRQWKIWQGQLQKEKKVDEEVARRLLATDAAPPPALLDDASWSVASGPRKKGKNKSSSPKIDAVAAQQAALLRHLSLTDDAQVHRDLLRASDDEAKALQMEQDQKMAQSLSDEQMALQLSQELNSGSLKTFSSPSLQTSSAFSTSSTSFASSHSSPPIDDDDGFIPASKKGAKAAKANAAKKASSPTPSTSPASSQTTSNTRSSPSTSSSTPNKPSQPPSNVTKNDKKITETKPPPPANTWASVTSQPKTSASSNRSTPPAPVNPSTASDAPAVAEENKKIPSEPKPSPVESVTKVEPAPKQEKDAQKPISRQEEKPNSPPEQQKPGETKQKKETENPKPVAAAEQKHTAASNKKPTTPTLEQRETKTEAVEKREEKEEKKEEKEAMSLVPETVPPSESVTSSHQSSDQTNLPRGGARGGRGTRGARGGRYTHDQRPSKPIYTKRVETSTNVQTPPLEASSVMEKEEKTEILQPASPSPSTAPHAVVSPQSASPSSFNPQEANLTGQYEPQHALTSGQSFSSSPLPPSASYYHHQSPSYVPTDPYMGGFNPFQGAMSPPEFLEQCRTAFEAQRATMTPEHEKQSLNYLANLERAALAYQNMQQAAMQQHHQYHPSPLPQQQQQQPLFTPPVQPTNWDRPLFVHPTNFQQQQPPQFYQPPPQMGCSPTPPPPPPGQQYSPSSFAPQYPPSPSSQPFRN